MFTVFSWCRNIFSLPQPKILDRFLCKFFPTPRLQTWRASFHGLLHSFCPLKSLYLNTVTNSTSPASTVLRCLQAPEAFSSHTQPKSSHLPPLWTLSKICPFNSSYFGLETSLLTLFPQLCLLSPLPREVTSSTSTSSVWCTLFCRRCPKDLKSTGKRSPDSSSSKMASALGSAGARSLRSTHGLARLRKNPTLLLLVPLLPPPNPSIATLLLLNLPTVELAGLPLGLAVLVPIQA